ncbi:MAG: glycosyltransferase family 39 protein [Candidatus Omnitrophica bacterium]|nr:glycosyltransferase family 39 protein [Candidatus Omnitrophota bacterium]
MEKNSPHKSYARIYPFIFLLIVTLSLSLLSLNLKNIIFGERVDEGYYLAYANHISHKGIGGYADLFSSYLGNQKNWLFPNPLRAGFILLSSLFVTIFGSDFFSLTYLSLFSYCILLFICFYFTRKYFDEKIAVLFTLLLAFSPLNMAMARRALIESTLNLFSILSIWLFFGLLKNRSNWKYILFISVYSFTILVKETAVLLSSIFVIYLIFHKFVFKKGVYLKDFLSTTLIPFAIAGFIYINLAGSLSNVIGTVKIVLASPETNQYAILFGSGPWFRYIIDYIILSPWVAILCIGFIFYYLLSKEYDEKTVYFLLVLIVPFLLFNIFTKNIRYVMILDVPMRLFSVLILKKLAEYKFPKYAFILIITLVITLSIFDYLNFRSLFLREGIYDPVSFLLLRAKHIIPYQ